jgi:hypothetical protein
LTEITEASLRRRLYLAMEKHLQGLSAEAKAIALDEAYEVGKFEDVALAADKIRTEECKRAAQIARRLGHPQTAQVILKGSSDV